MLKAFSEKKVYFPYPSYGNRKILVEHFLNKLGYNFDHNFPTSTIAHVTEGYTAGNVKYIFVKMNGFIIFYFFLIKVF